MTAGLPLHLISATDAAAAIAAGKLTSEALVAACLERIAQREAEVRAWACIDGALALKQARARDRESPRSRLHGIPVGVKDVIDTCDLPTEYGSPIYRGHRPVADAACVAQVRESGGVILGKAVSTEFATRHPNKTRNPRNIAHTPGGSSSGSAAAVADGMVPIAFGTQTSASIVRPAAYCGVIGYKPTFGLLNRAGLKLLSESLDTLGTLTRTVPDAALIVEALAGVPAPAFAEARRLKPRIGLCRTPYWRHADAASQANFERAAGKLAAAGATVVEVELAAEFAVLADTQVTVSGYEFSRALTHERTRHAELISASLTGRINAGLQVTRAQYEAGQALAVRCRARIADTLQHHDGTACARRHGRSAAGTGKHRRPGVRADVVAAASALPDTAVRTGPANLPLSVQVVARHGGDAALFLNAEWIRVALDQSSDAAQ